METNSAKSSQKSISGITIIPVFKETLKAKSHKNYPKSIGEQFHMLLESGDFSGEIGEQAVSYISADDVKAKVVFIGLGSAADFNDVHALHTGGYIGAILRDCKNKEVRIILEDKQEPFTLPFFTGMMLNTYKIDKLKSASKTSAHTDELPSSLTFDTGEKWLSQEKLYANFEKATVISNSVSVVKDLVNQPSNLVDMDYFTDTAKAIAKENGYKFSIIGESQLRQEGWGGLLAVNQGAESEPRCLVLEYKGGKADEKPIALVGKGVLFDTGGYNLKPTNFIETMHYDMAGAATVMGVFTALKKFNIKKNVVGIMPLAENLISGKAYRPSDIITMLSGKTVEITNTDAEGRLLLADAVTHAHKYKPTQIFTMATLTGAVVAALGDRYTGIMGNDSSIQVKLQRLGEKVDENVWSFPMPKHYVKKMESKVADLRNFDIDTGRYAGTIKAAGFIEYFVNETPWCHMDIAGTAFTKDPQPYQTIGATGHGVRLLLEYLSE
ncbi:aminopeptidase [Candidatus Peregrinibacteria bacterium HGW-Peregrinibacteria-1]|jgi:leucyl aminopeptidase|nr:MAG: aminopeptidase [Candidatus Peregrinibacteria bacterium HGW-Peregrinibacteria-1]